MSKLSGMTGTAVTEAEEFRKIYNFEVVVIPTYRQIKRIDYADSVYKTGRAKYTAVANSIEEAYKKGQPILVGTTSIDKNEIVSELLRRRKIPHEVLNAKNHLREAEIISNAGKKGAVTVATNMAGRGVDIVLGGETPKNEDGTVNENSPELKKWQKEHDEVLELGGLYVIGTERHESRRIDNQLRGRSGRQGDPGASRFFVALDDEIMRLFGGDRIAGIMTRFNMPEDVPLEHSLVTKSIENAQVKVEGFNFDTRKHLVEYDDVLNRQREIIYGRRRKILESSQDKENVLKDTVREKIHNAINATVDLAFANQTIASMSVNEEIVNAFNTIIPFDDASKKQLITQLEQHHDADQKIEFLSKIADDIYDKREEQIGIQFMQQIERFVMLSVIDNLWTNHLDAIDNLRGGIGLRGYAQRDPLVEYKNEAFRMFEQLVWAIDDEIVHRIYKFQVQQAPMVNNNPGGVTHAHADGSIHQGPEHNEVSMPTSKPKKIVTNTPQSEVSEESKNPQLVNKENVKKLGRNDPCPCGSGKKWKFCHYPQKNS